MKDGRGVERHESQCSCDTCKKLCTIAPCQGTADEMAAIQAAGFGDKLMAGFYMDLDTFEGPFRIVAIERNDSGCPFHTSDGLCALHDLGLKPSEGRLANHSTEDHGLKAEICKTFNSDSGRELLNLYDGYSEEMDSLFANIQLAKGLARLGRVISKIN